MPAEESMSPLNSDVGESCCLGLANRNARERRHRHVQARTGRTPPPGCARCGGRCVRCGPSPGRARGLAGAVLRTGDRAARPSNPSLHGARIRNSFRGARFSLPCISLVRDQPSQPQRSHSSSSSTCTPTSTLVSATEPMRDLTQQVALKALPRLATGTPAGRTLYLYTTARSVMASFWSRRALVPEAEARRRRVDEGRGDELVAPAPRGSGSSARWAACPRDTASSSSCASSRYSLLETAIEMARPSAASR